jgi:hypothetical protein
MPKLLILGHARHGKDTVAEILRNDFGLRFMSSSLFCAQLVMNLYPGRWASPDECYEDRVNHRPLWYETISMFNRDDPTRLARAIFEQNDIYIGMRSSREFNACKNTRAFDVCVWIDRSLVAPPEDRSSCTVEPWMADYMIDNNGSLEELRRNIHSFAKNILSLSKQQYGEGDDWGPHPFLPPKPQSVRQ